jgi:hypothetical protein
MDRVQSSFAFPHLRGHLFNTVYDFKADLSLTVFLLFKAIHPIFFINVVCTYSCLQRVTGIAGVWTIEK